MNETKLRGAMGFAMRAGKCITGDFASERAVKYGSACWMVLLDESASEATQKRYHAMCEQRKIPCLLIPDMGRSIGKDGRMVAVITDAQFAKMIQTAYESEDNAN